jgi:hypothetical protein
MKTFFANYAKVHETFVFIIGLGKASSLSLEQNPKKFPFFN